MTPQERVKNIKHRIGVPGYSTYHECLASNDLAWLLARVERLEGALRFYAEGFIQDNGRSCSLWDGGLKAKAALEEGT